MKRGQKLKNRTCPKCEAVFSNVRDLQAHVNNRKTLSCAHCNAVFCNEFHLGKHMRTINEAKIITKNYNSVIHAKTGFEDDPKYQKIIEEKKAYINDFEVNYTHHKVINERIPFDFTYYDLDMLLTEIYANQKCSFKLNLGMGFIVYNLKTGDYKYHYVSSNQLLFEKAIAITYTKD